MSKWEYIKTNYIDKGLRIFPVEPNGKTPLIENWQNDCSCEYMQVLYWYTNCPNCNWGLPCTPNELFVLDLDVHDENKNGIDSFNKIINEISDFPFEIDLFGYCDTIIQETPSGGIHVIYKTDDDLKNVSNGSNVFEKYPGIDIRTDGYIVVEPSEIKGNEYKIISENKDISVMPKELKEFVLSNANLKTEKRKEPYKKPTHVDIGDRDNQLFDYINDLYFKTRLDYDEILLLANRFNETVFEKPLPEKTVAYKVKKAFNKDRGTCIFVKLSE